MTLVKQNHHHWLTLVSVDGLIMMRTEGELIYFLSSFFYHDDFRLSDHDIVARRIEAEL